MQANVHFSTAYYSINFVEARDMLPVAVRPT
eukprot:SAG22_NODE_3902_length_1476_cov_1.803922_2_plen_31_part_01